MSDYNISIIKIPKTAPELLKIDLFRRLNTGIAKLNAQELRNCLHRGRYNDCIKKLATYENYRAAMGFSTQSVKRMKLEEYVLMFGLFYSTPLDR